MDKPKKHKVVFRDKIFDLAPKIAEARSLASAYAYKKGSKRYRENEDHVSTTGVLGELIHRDWCRRKTVTGEFDNVEFGQLVDLDPDIAPDGVIDGETFDVKYKNKEVSHMPNRVFVNYDSHNNPDKTVDKYFFVEPIEGTCHAGMCDALMYEWDASDGDSWAVGDWGKGPVYYHDIKDGDCEEM